MVTANIPGHDRVEGILGISLGATIEIDRDDTASLAEPERGWLARGPWPPPQGA